MEESEKQYKQLGAEERATITGHGLGLAISQRVAASHGGTVCAVNRPGGGLCVEIVLPVKSL